MELAELHVFEPEIFEPVVFGVGDASSIGNSAPCIKGHISGTDSSFTFKVNGSDVSVSVDASGDWKYKPTATITSLAFVGVPQLESLVLNKITGVSTFNLDYPVVPVFKKCDATTEAALVYVYHIRGTATDNFQFTLRYIDDNDTVTTVTESAVIDGNGKWDVSYSGKKIYGLNSTFKDKTALLTLDFSAADDFSKVTNMGSMCVSSTEGTSALTQLIMGNKKLTLSVSGSWAQYTSIEQMDLSGVDCDDVTDVGYLCVRMKKLKEVNFGNNTFKYCNQPYYMFKQCELLETIHLDHATFESVSENTNEMFKSCTSLVNLYVPNSSSFPKTFSLSDSPLSYDSMLRVAGWLKNVKGGTAQTVTFNATTYNALTTEQKAALTAIIVTEKGWNLATA